MTQLRIRTSAEITNVFLRLNKRSRGIAIGDLKWISVDSLLEFLNNNSNPCMNCGSVQCAVCSDKLIEQIERSIEKDGEN